MILARISLHGQKRQSSTCGVRAGICAHLETTSMAPSPALRRRIDHLLRLLNGQNKRSKFAMLRNGALGLNHRWWSNARTGGNIPVQRSISTMLVPLDGPWLSFEVPRSWVSTLALPCAHRVPSSLSAGSYHAPHDSLTTPERAYRSTPRRQGRPPGRYGRARRRHP